MTNTWSITTGRDACFRCGGELCAMLHVPPEFAGWPAGSLGEGTFRRVPLCQRCDGDEPSAQGVLAFFALHPQLDADNIKEFEVLLSQWLRRLPPARVVDAEAFKRDVEAWQRGDFDDDPLPEG
jgi:hypothetical protein